MNKFIFTYEYGLLRQLDQNGITLTKIYWNVMSPIWNQIHISSEITLIIIPLIQFSRQYIFITHGFHLSHYNWQKSARNVCQLKTVFFWSVLPSRYLFVFTILREGQQETQFSIVTNNYWIWVVQETKS